MGWIEFQHTIVYAVIQRGCVCPTIEEAEKAASPREYNSTAGQGVEVHAVMGCVRVVVVHGWK